MPSAVSTLDSVTAARTPRNNMPELIDYDPARVTFSPVTAAQFTLLKQSFDPDAEFSWGFDGNTLTVEIIKKHGALRFVPNESIFDEIKDYLNKPLSQ